MRLSTWKAVTKSVPRARSLVLLGVVVARVTLRQGWRHTHSWLLESNSKDGAVGGTFVGQASKWRKFKGASEAG